MNDSVTWQALTVHVPGHDVPLPVRVFHPVPARPGGLPHTNGAAVPADRGTPDTTGETAPARPGWLVWAHGGSWRSGSTAAWHPALADLARRSGATIVGVDYRLAPEHRHPAPLRDVLAVLAWADGQAAGAPVAVGGDSAGATLAASAAVVRRDLGLPLAAQVLAYPPLDPECRAESYRRDPEAFPERAALRAAWRDHHGSGAAPAGEGRRLYGTPREAADLSGVAPAALVVGGLDPVADDVRDYAAALERSEVPVRFVELAATAHGAFLTSADFRDRLATAYHDVLTTLSPAGAPR